MPHLVRKKRVHHQKNREFQNVDMVVGVSVVLHVPLTVIPSRCAPHPIREVSGLSGLSFVGLCPLDFSDSTPWDLDPVVVDTSGGSVDCEVPTTPDRATDAG